MAMRLLFIGDIFAKSGRAAVRGLLPSLRSELKPDVVIANAENIAGGAGLTADTCKDMLALGIDALTSGNHVWDRREVFDYLKSDPPVLRPLNYPEGTPGRGSMALPDHDLLLVNLQGRVFMRALDDPFRAMDALLAENTARHVFVDFHAEATAEKKALAFYLDGRVSAVVGTHTHVPTADAQILPRGTGFLSDVGMVGPALSIIGNEAEGSLRRYTTQLPGPVHPARGKAEFNAVCLDFEGETGRTSAIKPIHLEWPEPSWQPRESATPAWER